MSTAMLIEMVGYLGSALVLFSMLMSSVVKLRVINMIGSAIFATYAMIIHSYPTAFMNGCLVLINLYNLMKLIRKDKHYDLVEEQSESGLFAYIWKYYREDLLKFFPDFDLPQKQKEDKIFIVCCDTVPAGFLMGKDKGNGVLEVTVDYSTPAYRDCSVGKYLYGQLPKFGVRQLICPVVEVQKHKEYLTKMGFKKDRTGEYKKDL